MSKGRLRLLLSALLLLGGGTAASAFGSKGTSGAAFLKIGPGARPAGMGEAFSAVSGDPHAAYYNPAGLAPIREWRFAGMHDAYFQGMDYNFLTLAVPVDRLLKRSTGTWTAYRGVAAISVYNLSVDDIERRGTTDTDSPEGTFGADDMAIAVSYARKLREEMAAGAALKVIRQSLDDKSAVSFAADAGIQYLWGRRLTLSGGLRNLGSSPKFVAESDPLPLTGYLGGAFRRGDGLLLTGDIGLPRDRLPTLSVGAEYTRRFSTELRGALRGGWFTRNMDAEGFSGLSMGFGVGFRSADFDFAWVPFGDLGNTFRYSLQIKF